MFKNNFNFDFDEVFYIFVYLVRECFQFEVMDFENVGKDCSFGLMEIFFGDYMVQGEFGEWFVYDEKKEYEDGLCIYNKGIFKGIFIYIVVFYFIFNIVDFEEEVEKEKKRFEEEKEVVDEEKEEGKEFDVLFGLDVFCFIEVGKFLVDFKELVMFFMFKIFGIFFLVIFFFWRLYENRELFKVYFIFQELFKKEFGFIIFKFMEVDLFKSQICIEVFVDDMVFFLYIFLVVKKLKMIFDEIGDCFICELEFFKLIIKVLEKMDSKEGKKE